MGVASDITARKTTEDALAVERAFLRTLIDTIPDLVWLKDAEGRFLACNPPFERLLGAKEADIVGRTDYDFVPAGLADAFRERDRAAMAAGRALVNEEWVTFADEDRPALLETIKVPMFDADACFVGVLGVGRDVTALRKTQDALREREAIHSAPSSTNRRTASLCTTLNRDGSWNSTKPPMQCWAIAGRSLAG